MDPQGQNVYEGPQLPQQPAGSAGVEPPVTQNPFSPVGQGQQAPQQFVQIDMTQMQLLMAQMVETAQAASQAAQAAVARPSSNLTSGFSDANKILNRPSEFGSGVHDNDLANWSEWSHSFRTWLVFAESQFEQDLKLVEDNLQGPVDLTGASPDRIARSQRLYAILASILRSKPKAILRQVSNRNGLEVWRVLTNTFAPKSKFRGLALLNALMTLPSFGKDRSLREHIQGLERIAEEYQRVTGHYPGEEVMLGTLVRSLPSAIKQHVQLQMTDSSNYQSIRDYVLGYEVTTTSWTPAKMHQALGVVPLPSSVAGSTATTAKRVARVEIDMTSSAFQDDDEISGHLRVLTKVCPEDPAAATAQPSFASLCKSLAFACVDPLKPHVLVPVPKAEVFDMSYSDSDCVWTVPNEMREAACVGCLSSAREYVTCRAPARSHARQSRRSRQPLQCEPTVQPCESAAEHLVSPPVHPLQDLRVCAVSWADVSNEIEVVVDSGRGWDIIHSDGVPYLTNPGGTVRVPMHYRHNSLHARGSIMSVVVCANDCLNDDREDNAVHEPQEATPLSEGDELDDEYAHRRDQQVEVPQSGEAGGPDAAAVRAIKLGSAWLNLGSQYTEMQPGIFARQDQSNRFLDVSVPLGHHGVSFRTTLQYDGAEWKLIEINCLTSLFDDLEKEFEPKGSRHIITIGSVDPLQVEKLFDQQHVPWNDESYDGEYADAPPDESMIEEDENAEDDDGGGVGPVPPAEVPSQGHVVVNGVELHPGCTLKTLRSACEVLGIGKSGGKATVFARIEQHLKTQELLQQHAFQTDGVPLPLEQKFVEEPTAEQKRRHELSHVPFADWCPHCVKFRAKADKHVSSKPELRDDSVCSFDFAYTGRSSPAEFEGASKDKLVCLVLKDSHTGAMHAVPTPAKGGPVAFKYLVAEVCRFLNYCGHESVTIRSDGEPACLALQQGIKAFRTKMGLRTHLEQTEPGDHQSNASEQAIDSIRQLAGCILDQFEERAQTTVGAMHPVHAYAWRHAAWLHMRMSRHNDLSAFQVINGRPYAGKLVCFGENVYARVKSSVKGKARWCKMLWLGKLPVSDLHFGVTEGGIMLSSRSVRRLPKQYDSSLCAKLRDMPWSQASFLAGQVGQARKQKTLEGDEGAGTEPQVEQQAEVPSQAGAAENPLPFPGHLLPDDAMLQEFVPPLPREPVLHSPEPPTPVAATPGQQAETPMQVETASPLVSFDDGPGIASSSSGIARPATEEAGGEAPARKKLRLDAVQTSAHDCEMFHHDEAPELLDESAEQFLDCADESLWDTEDWTDDAANAPDIPSILIKPFSETEPVCDASELEAIDAAADSFELDRLTKAGVLEQSESWLEGHRTLSSKYVRTWRPKVIKGERVWLRRARLVAREFAHLDPGRQHLFAPTTTQCMLRIVPSLFIRNFGDGWSLLSLDVSDAFLQCKQQHDTLTKVDGKWYKLFRMLPGQRDGSATWFQDFMCEIRAAVAAEPFAEQPVLFRIPHAEGSHMCQGGGMVHVDDMLAAGLTARLQELENHLKSKFKVSSEWIRQVGDEVSFLKRRLILVSPNLLVVEPDIKYLEKLLKITGLDGAKERYKAAPFPTGGLPTDLSSDRELNSECASKYRSALGILMYLASDLLACQFGIRFLSTHAHKPTEGCWKLLRHLTAYVNCHKSHVLGLAKPQLGQGLICNRVSEQKTSILEMFSDSDWSGDKKTRKSVSACCILWDGQLLHSSSQTQKVISLSSCEAEYNSLVAGSATAILLKNCIIHLCPELHIALTCLCDNAAARSLGNRQGVGRTRHIDGKLLWLQQMTQEKMLDISPVGTAENVGDLPTKPLKPERVEFILARLNVRDKDCGYALVGNAHLLDHRTRHHVSRIVKRGAVNPQLVLQILALALQADSVASADDEPNTHRDDALSQGTGEHGYGEMFWNFLEQLLYAIFLIADFLAEHPMPSFIVSQCVIIAVLCGIFLCRGNRPERLHEKASEAAASSDSSAPQATPGVCVNVTVEGACRRVGMSYVGVTENMQSDSVFKEVRRYLLNFACDCVFVHVSTPCSSGSYLRRFSGGSSSKSDWEWFEVFPCVLKYLKLGKHSSFELPWNNEIWQHDLCQKVLKKAGHTFDVPVRLGGPKQVFTLRNSLMRLFEVRTRAAMVLTTDERRELRRLLDKMDSADGLASTANTSMTDGAKRLRDVGGYPEDGSTASGSACGAQLPISKGSAKGVVSTPKCYEDLVDAFEGEEFGESDNVIVVSYAGTEITSVPLPSDLSVEDWGRTICDLPKVQKNKTWFKKSYAALVKLSKEDSDLASYLNWVKEKFGRSYDPTTPSSQASDLAGYLMRIGFSKQKGFQRKLAEE
ncbi:GIP [Symbiodinium sp. CCMP2592]|nr:GIP [Symbiodinium sp. CCMP2592]